jgi:hypothetical protein
LRQETDEGWDAKLPTSGTDFYYQFKLSDYLSRGNAKYLRDRTYEEPYYRFALHRRNQNRQHQMLKKLSESKRDTYYVAPEISDVDIFTTAYLNRTLTDYSRLIPVRDCPAITDDRQCYVSYQAGSPAWNFHSSRNPREHSILGKELEDFYTQSIRKARRLDRAFANDVFERIQTAALVALEEEEIRIADSTLRLLQTQAEPGRLADFLRAAADILHSVFGCTLVIVGNAEEPIT